ncbi:MAG TPA: SDR family oxidoreductase [Acidimicrobiales bacterium]|jgi:NAD(P)-dependent dehydrogenase (short-subunit alcohol dehydrogenase family)|nr:SDR family oxidoreductase [Acidimicrobiales bacterium]
MVTLAGKAVVVTGAGRGLGRAYAMTAAAAGAAVVVNDLDREPAESVVAEITAAGGRAVVQIGDVSVAKEAVAMVDRCVDEYGAIDGLVNNAGFGMIDASAPQEEDEEHFRRVFEVNVFGTALCGQQALRHMLAEGRGSIVNIASGSMTGTQQLGSYSASKGAVASLTRSWALDLRDSGIRVNAVAPMAVTRNWNWDLIPNRSAVPPAERLRPECNAGVVVYLLSDQAAAVHGQLVAIRGGQLSLVAHPAAVEPAPIKDMWTADDVAGAFDAQFAGRLAPLGWSTVRSAVVD